MSVVCIVLLSSRLFRAALFPGLAVVLLTACKTPESEKISLATDESAASLVAPDHMASALSAATGYSLGARSHDKRQSQVGLCAAKMRYTAEQIAMLYCWNSRSEKEERIQAWINFSRPEHGNRVWKISLNIPGDAEENADFIERLHEKYGSPRVVNRPLSMSWAASDVYLRVQEDRFGLQLELWDRTGI
ncbi:hypothetical protein [Sneathiella chinensis]|uniref:Lipoprotein n=1 Tax=Sneathiella chinensis TaxID=349750 RepID=A0ABQ5TYH6_9PROT|nr:hypothetical protein [Sneathiella chinensis]GLQ04860.1 hypothetical protein GCM10007924_00810 [Sneathiella chinensis]